MSDPLTFSDALSAFKTSSRIRGRAPSAIRCALVSRMSTARLSASRRSLAASFPVHSRQRGSSHLQPCMYSGRWGSWSFTGQGFHIGLEPTQAGAPQHAESRSVLPREAFVILVFCRDVLDRRFRFIISRDGERMKAYPISTSTPTDIELQRAQGEQLSRWFGIDDRSTPPDGPAASADARVFPPMRCRSVLLSRRGETAIAGGGARFGPRFRSPGSSRVRWHPPPELLAGAKPNALKYPGHRDHRQRSRLDVTGPTMCLPAGWAAGRAVTGAPRVRLAATV